jgi:hypothetical protein
MSTDIAKTLEERGSRYGRFEEHARITQNILAAMRDSPNWAALPPDMKESLTMVAHKAGRILNGDPNYADSWVDIAGYATLVADRLVGGGEGSAAPEAGVLIPAK